MAVARATQTAYDDGIEAMRNSVIHGLKPISENLFELEIDRIEEDPTNPGTVTTSLRYQRRDPSIRDSFDILGRIVYPVAVCEQEGDPSRFIHLDGAGRLRQLKERGVRMVKAIVYPYMDLEQRILFRQVLNAAQEAFDVVSILADLRQLARERGLSLEDPNQVKTLVRDLPARVRRYEKDLLTLATWDPEAVDRLGESGDLSGGTIGIDKLRALERMRQVALERHPKVVEEVGGDQGLMKKISTMYLNGTFSTGARSQEIIRRVNKAMKVSEENGQVVRRFFTKGDNLNDVTRLAQGADRSRDLKSACSNLLEMLLDVDSSDLTAEELRILRRTQAVLEGVLE